MPYAKERTKSHVFPAAAQARVLATIEVSLNNGNLPAAVAALHALGRDFDRPLEIDDSTPLGEILEDARVLNILEEHGVTTVGEARARTDAQLATIPHIGPHGLALIRLRTAAPAI